jgi:hypothetical protein
VLIDGRFPGCLRRPEKAGGLARQVDLGDRLWRGHIAQNDLAMTGRHLAAALSLRLGRCFAPLLVSAAGVLAGTTRAAAMRDMADWEPAAWSFGGGVILLLALAVLLRLGRLTWRRATLGN